MQNWIEITAIVVGPLAAVAISVWREETREKRDRKVSIMRQLLLTRANIADPAFSTAINLVPIEFGHNNSVMTAWESFIKAADRNEATAEQTNELLKLMMRTLGFGDRAASQVARSAYVALAQVQQRSLLDNALKGVVAIAENTDRSASALITIASQITRLPSSDSAKPGIPPIPTTIPGATNPADYNSC